MLRPYIGPWVGSVACPACAVWDIAAGPHATDCAFQNDLLDYLEDCASGRVNEPGYWLTLDELQASLAARKGRA